MCKKYKSARCRAAHFCSLQPESNRALPSFIHVFSYTSPFPQQGSQSFKRRYSVDGALAPSMHSLSFSGLLNDRKSIAPFVSSVGRTYSPVISAMDSLMSANSLRFGGSVSCCFMRMKYSSGAGSDAVFMGVPSVAIDVGGDSHCGTVGMPARFCSVAGAARKAKGKYWKK